MMTARTVRGATAGIEIALYEPDPDNPSRPSEMPADLTGQTRVRVAIAASRTATPLITRDTDTDGATLITVTDSPAVVTVYPTESESLALPIGTVVAMVWVTIGGHEAASRVAMIRVEEGIGEPG